MHTNDDRTIGADSKPKTSMLSLTDISGKKKAPQSAVLH